MTDQMTQTEQTDQPRQPAHPAQAATRILVTAFDPFGGEPVNPALEAVKSLAPTIEGAEIITVEVPTVFGAAIERAAAAIDEHRPDAVLCVGQAGGRFEVTPERVAINVDDARIPDNAGHQPIEAPIAVDGPPAYFATLPVKAMVQAIRDAGVPSSLSNTAGTFVCNHIMYGVLHHIAATGATSATTGEPIRAGFTHVPFTPAQVVGKPGQPALSIDDDVRALTAAIGAIVHHGQDVRTAEGATH